MVWTMSIAPTVRFDSVGSVTVVVVATDSLLGAPFSAQNASSNHDFPLGPARWTVREIAYEEYVRALG